MRIGNFDQLDPGKTTLSGFVVFEDPIKAAMVLCDELDSGDPDIGSASTSYANCTSTGDFRPVDWLTTGDNEGIVISGDRHQISFTLRTSNVFDQIRVVTEPGGVSALPLLAPLSIVFLVIFLVGLGVAVGLRSRQALG